MSDEKKEKGTRPKLSPIERWAFGKSFKVLPFGNSHALSEYKALFSPKYNLGQLFGEGVAASPRDADVLLVFGPISKKMSPVLKRIYDQMSAPKWVVACSDPNSLVSEYAVAGKIEELIPVDLFITGNPPTPCELHEGLLSLKALIKRGECQSENISE